MLPRTKLMAPNPLLLTPTSLCLWKAARQVSHIPLHHQKKRQLLLLAWTSRRFRGTALENSRDSPRRTEMKPKEKYKWRKKQGWEPGLERNKQRCRKGGKEKRKI